MIRAFAPCLAAGLALAGCTSVPADRPGTAKLVWSDEFDGDRVDSARWSFTSDCWGGGNEERQCYTDNPANASVAGGILTITARNEPTTGFALNAKDRKTADDPGKLKTQPFSSAKLTTEGKADWLYGRFEVRARLPRGQGTWPAIWMLPADWAYGGWAASGEIDILEAVNLGAPCGDCKGGVEDRILGTLHFGGEWPGNKSKGDEYHYPPILDGDFHVFALHWSPDRMVWTVDGKPFAERRSSEWFTTASDDERAPFDKPFYLILNLAVGGGLSEGRNLKTVDPSAFPARLEIDWIRVWQCADETAGGRGGAC